MVGDGGRGLQERQSGLVSKTSSFLCSTPEGWSPKMERARLGACVVQDKGWENSPCIITKVGKGALREAMRRIDRSDDEMSQRRKMQCRVGEGVGWRMDGWKRADGIGV